VIHSCKHKSCNSSFEFTAKSAQEEPELEPIAFLAIGLPARKNALVHSSIFKTFNIYKTYPCRRVWRFRLEQALCTIPTMLRWSMQHPCLRALAPANNLGVVDALQGPGDGWRSLE
jgi:hypothetical protein